MDNQNTSKPIKKNRTPWNKGLKGIVGNNKGKTWKISEQGKRNISLGHIGITTWNKGKHLTPEHIAKIKLANSEERSCHWKGDNAGYQAMHKWIYKKRGQPNYCEFCKESDSKRQYHWSNISRKYKRDVDDWQRLCVKCHKQYDLKQIYG